MKAEAVIDLLRVRYAAPAYAFLEQVGNSTGWTTNRHADAVVMGLYPSRGLEVIGIEVKVDRRDWQLELARPDKAEPIARYCDKWLIAAPKGVVDLNELPTNWGLIEVTEKGKLITTKAPAKLDAEPLDRRFIAAILRRASASTPTIEMRAAARKEAREEADRDLEGRVAWKTNALRGELEQLRRRVQDFEQKTGMPLEKVPNSVGFYGFASGEDLAAAYLLIANGGAKKLKWQLDSLRNVWRHIGEITGELEAVIDDGDEAET